MNHYILFTGHMIDTKDRKDPRFPTLKEERVRFAIRKFLIEKKAEENSLSAIAGGACGGDIIFHELCLELNIQSEMYLALPAGKFKKESVSFAGKNWEERSDKLQEQVPSYVLPKEAVKSQNVWEDTNLWMLTKALKNGGKNMTLLALWDKQEGDGKGGTEHMVKVAKKEKAEILIIDINTI